MSQTRQLAAIMFTDIVGYTALMGSNEQKAFEFLRKNRGLHIPVIEQCHGRVIKELGDGMMASFNTVSDAVSAAIRIMEACHAANEFQLRIGIHQGEVVFESGDIFGDAVNIAARIQSSAQPGTIYVSESVHHNVANKNDIQTRFVKQETLKNVKEPVRLYEVVIANSPAKPAEDKKKIVAQQSIAVLPFANMSSDPEQEYFSDGISEEIINMLAQVPRLKVAGRTSSFSFKGKNQDLRIIGEQLNVNYILEGSVRKSGNKIRITAQLINASDGYHLYSEKFDRDLADIFEVQDEISLAILNAIKIKLLVDEKEAVLKKYTDNVEAYQLYLQGRYHVNKYDGTESFLNGIRYYKEAIKIEPRYALAYAGMAYCYMELSMDNLLPEEECKPQLYESVKRAMELDDDLAESLCAQANLNMFFDWDFSTAVEQLYKKALEINPNSAEAQRFYAFYLFFTGHLEEACKHAAIAHDIDPFSLSGDWEVAWIYIFSGKLDKGLALGRRMIEMEPAFFGGYLIVGVVLDCQENYEEAEPLLRKSVDLYPIFTTFRNLGVMYCRAGNRTKALEMLAEMESLSKKTIVPHNEMGTIYSFLGEFETAAWHFEKAVEKREALLLFTRYNFSMRNDSLYVPQIADILEKVEALKKAK